MKNYYYSVVNKNQADFYIYGDITSCPEDKNAVTSRSLATELSGLDVETVNLYINSYGGEVAEGLAIYNELKRHPAKINTYCDGFACSAASVVFMAGDNRFMYPASLLMIHNAWNYAVGNADELRKAAEDLDKISTAAANTYKIGLSITDEELAEMLKNETWLSPQEALEKGFATAILAAPETMKASQNSRAEVVNRILNYKNTENNNPCEGLSETKTKKFFNVRRRIK